MASAARPAQPSHLTSILVRANVTSAFLKDGKLHCGADSLMRLEARDIIIEKGRKVRASGSFVVLGEAITKISVDAGAKLRIKFKTVRFGDKLRITSSGTVLLDSSSASSEISAPSSTTTTTTTTAATTTTTTTAASAANSVPTISSSSEVAPTRENLEDENSQSFRTKFLELTADGECKISSLDKFMNVQWLNVRISNNAKISGIASPFCKIGPHSMQNQASIIVGLLPSGEPTKPSFISLYHARRCAPLHELVVLGSDGTIQLSSPDIVCETCKAKTCLPFLSGQQRSDEVARLDALYEKNVATRKAAVEKRRSASSVLSSSLSIQGVVKFAGTLFGAGASANVSSWASAGAAAAVAGATAAAAARTAPSTTGSHLYPIATATSDGAPESECPVCKDAPVNMTIVPCGHTTCRDCALLHRSYNKRKCPICNITIERVMALFVSLAPRNDRDGGGGGGGSEDNDSDEPAAKRARTVQVGAAATTTTTTSAAASVVAPPQVSLPTAVIDLIDGSEHTLDSDETFARQMQAFYDAQ